MPKAHATNSFFEKLEACGATDRRSEKLLPIKSAGLGGIRRERCLSLPPQMACLISNRHPGKFGRVYVAFYVDMLFFIVAARVGYSSTAQTVLVKTLFIPRQNNMKDTENATSTWIGAL